jgi:hypothetical protein
VAHWPEGPKDLAVHVEPLVINKGLSAVFVFVQKYILLFFAFMLSSVAFSISNLKDQLSDMSFIFKTFSGQLATHAKQAIHFSLSASPDSASMAPVGMIPRKPCTYCTLRHLWTGVA